MTSVADVLAQGYQPQKKDPTGVVEALSYMTAPKPQAHIDYSSLPMGANPEQDPVIGYAETGEPIRRARFGGAEYSIQDQQTVPRGSAVKAAWNDPLGTASGLASGIAGSIWNGLQTPGRAASGETITNGDLADTLGLAAVGPMGGAAPQGALRSGLSRTETSQQILDMLKGGKASEVTDAMMAAADPQHLYNNYDLPMDTASRMGRANDMGFDTETPLYRGDRDLQAYSTGAPGPREGIGVTSSSSPNIAATYLPDNGTIAPIISKSQNRLELDAGGRNWTGVPADATTNRGALNDAIDPATYLDDENLFDFQNGIMTDWGDGTKTSMAISDTNSVSRAAQNAGFDEVRFANIKDRGGAGQWHTGPANDPHTTIMTANPANIRSRFARFDPRLKHLANLSAGVAGVGVMGNMTNEDEIRAYLGGIK